MPIPVTHYAPSGEILIAYQVHGSGELRFADRGGHELEGIDEPWHLYALTLRPSA